MSRRGLKEAPRLELDGRLAVRAPWSGLWLMPETLTACTVASVLVLVALLGRAERLSTLYALGLAVPPVAAAVLGFRLGTPQEAHPNTVFDPRSVALWIATLNLLLVGPTLLVVGCVVAAHRDLRRAGMAVLPGAALLTIWTLVLTCRLRALSDIPHPRRLEGWLWNPSLITALVVATFVAAGTSAALARRPVPALVALAPVLPILAWPEHWVWGLLRCE